MLKLADFGLAKRSNGSGNHTEYVSTRWYRAPELVLRSQNYKESIDMFALGCIMAEMYLGRPLFPGTSEADQLTRIVTVMGTPSASEWPEGQSLATAKGISFPTSKNSFREQFSRNVPEDALDLMAQMLRYSADKRPTAQTCLQHDFFRSVPAALRQVAEKTGQRRHRGRVRQMPTQDLAPGLLGSTASLIGKDDSKPRFPSLDRSDNSIKQDEIVGRPFCNQDVVPISLQQYGSQTSIGAIAGSATKANGNSKLGLLNASMEGDSDREKENKFAFNPRVSKYG